MYFIVSSASVALGRGRVAVCLFVTCQSVWSEQEESVPLSETESDAMPHGLETREHEVSWFLVIRFTGKCGTREWLVSFVVKLLD